MHGVRRPTASVQARAARTVTRITIACLSIIHLVACAETEEATPQASVLAPPVLVEKATRRHVIDRIKATGELTAKADATIAAQVDGAITELRVREGDAVVAGDVLLVIDPARRQLEVANAEAQLAEAKAELAVATRNYERTKQLSKGNAASEARLDEDRTRESLARSARAGAEARLGLARRALEDSTVRAPFDGLIARRHVSTGEYLTVGTPLYELVALDPIEVEFTLAEVDSSKVAHGYPITVAVAPYPDERFTAVVSMISPTIDPNTRTLRVKADLPNPDGLLRPGLFAHVDLGVSEREGAITVGIDAVLQRADGSVVYRLVDTNRVERVRVETGVRADDWVEIREGLDAEDVVVLRGHARLEDGIAVTLRQEDGSAVPGAAVAAPPKAAAPKEKP